jgi:predicted Zn-ribbon and HTH transcriptional regulator
MRKSVLVHVCARCGHEWMPLVQKPRVCPRCKSYVWKKPPRAAKEARAAAEAR